MVDPTPDPKKPDEVEQPEPDVEEVDTDETETETDDDDETDEPDKPEEAANGEDKEPVVDANADRLRELELENAMLRGRDSLAKEQAERTTTRTQAEDDDDEFELPTEEEIDAGLRKEPARYLRNLLSTVAEKATRRATRVAESKATELTGAERARQNDENIAFQRFPELRDNEEFRNFTNTIMSTFAKRNGGYRTGDVVAAAAVAYGELVNDGKIEPRRNGKKPAEAQTPRERVRGAIASPGLRTTRPGANGKKDPFEGFSSKERSSIEKSCKELDITPEQWRKNYDRSVLEREA